MASLAEPGGCSARGCGEGGPSFCEGGGSPRAAAGSSCPGLGGGTGKPILGRAAGAGLVVLGSTPGCRGSGGRASRGFYSGNQSSGAAVARPCIPGASITLRRSLPAPQKKSVTCFNFGIRQEEDGFVSSATPFQLFPERQRLEDVAGPNYNIHESTPAALPGFAPAAGTVSSSRASRLMEGFPLRGLVPCAPVLWMALHKARLRMRGSAPAGAFPGWVRAGARAAGPQSWGVGVMGSRNAWQRCGRRWAPAVRPRSCSEPAPSQFAGGDQKLIAGFRCTWQERG